MSCDGAKRVPDPLPLRVVLLTNILPNYRVALLEPFSAMVADLKILLSARNEANRRNRPAWGSLQVGLQRSISWIRRFRNVHGFEDESHIHVPIDTMWQLFRCRPDVILSAEFGARTIFSVMYKKLRPKTCLIVWATLSRRTEESRGALRQSLRRMLVRYADGIFVNGSDGESYVRSLGFKGPVTHIPYVVDDAAFSSVIRSDSDGQVRLLYAGQLIERKGLLGFMERLQRWASAYPKVRLQMRIAGDGPLRRRLEELASKASFPVTFIGHIEGERLLREYSEASIYVFPTHADEWGVVVNEALSAGVPVLGSCHSQSVMELVKDGQNGWVFDPTDETSTFAALDRALLTSPEELREMSEPCRQAMTGYTPYAITLRMRDAIASIANKS